MHPGCRNLRKERVFPLNEHEELDLITVTDENDNEVTLEVLDYFFYNGEEYAILTEAHEGCCCDCDDCDCEEHHHECDCEGECECDEEEEITCYIMKVVPKDENGEEFEEFIPVEDEALEAKLIEVAMTKLESEDDLDDAE